MVEGSEQQIKFNGSPFRTLGGKLLDCARGVDHSISRKKGSKKVRIICSPKH